MAPVLFLPLQVPELETEGKHNTLGVKIKQFSKEFMWLSGAEEQSLHTGESLDLFLHICLDLTSLMFCFLPFCTIACSWTIPTLCVQLYPLLAWVGSATFLHTTDQFGLKDAQQIPAYYSSSVSVDQEHVSLWVPAHHSHQLLWAWFQSLPT